jgi:hypothetical protein
MEADDSHVSAFSGSAGESVAIGDVGSVNNTHE